MRILIVGINFAPELTGVGKYTGEMASWFAQRGHRVTVVTAPPYYPAWRIGDGYRSWTWRRERWQNCTVIRCPLYVPRNVSALRRLAHLASFAVSSALATLSAALAGKHDVVIAVAPTLLSAPMVLATAWLTGAKTWLHIQDFEAEAAHHFGLVRRGLLQRAAAAFERAVLKRFDLVSSISPRMVERLAAKGVTKERRILFPNWVDTDAISPLNRPSALRRELEIAEGRIVALYAGSMGEKHGLDTLVRMARFLAAGVGAAASPLVVLAGDGPARQQLEAMASGLANIRFIDLQPAERLNELLNLANIHLLPQREDVADLVMPSKLGPMLASGRPVIATAVPGSQLAAMIAGAGVIVPPGDAMALAQAIRKLAVDPGLRRHLGETARRQVETELNAEQVLGRMEERLCVLMASAPSANISKMAEPHDNVV